MTSTPNAARAFGLEAARGNPFGDDIGPGSLSTGATGPSSMANSRLAASSITDRSFCWKDLLKAGVLWLANASPLPFPQPRWFRRDLPRILTAPLVGALRWIMSPFRH